MAITSYQLASAIGKSHALLIAQIRVYRGHLEENGPKLKLKGGMYALTGEQAQYILSLQKRDPLSLRGRLLLEGMGLIFNPESEVPETQISPMKKEKKISTISLAKAIGSTNSDLVRSINRNKKHKLEALGGEIRFEPRMVDYVTATGNPRKVSYKAVAELSIVQAIELLKGMKIFPLPFNKRVALSKLGIDTELLVQSSQNTARQNPPKYSSKDDLTEKQKQELSPPRNSLHEARETLVQLCDRRGLTLEIYPRYVVLSRGGETVYIGTIEKALDWLQGVASPALKEKALEWARKMKTTIEKRNCHGRVKA